MIRDEVVAVVFEALERVNSDLPPDLHLARKEETELLGEKSVIDSLGLFILLSAIDEKLEEKFGITGVLGDDAIAAQESPLRSVGTLIDHIVEASG